MAITRRAWLLAAGGLGATAALAAGCDSTATPSETGTVSTPDRDAAVTRHAYGSDPNQFGELYRPTGGTTRPGTVVILHGGFWRAQYDLSLGRPLAADLARRGWKAWNLEYRRVGQGGGWPGTFADVAAGIDALAGLDVDTDHVCAVGHSAGGHLAGWAIARPKLPASAPGANPRVRLTAAVSQAGVLELATAARQQVGATAVPDLMGGGPDEYPDRYAVADPSALLPVPGPVLCVHDRDDDIVPLSQSTAYLDDARRTGSRATLREVDGDHFTLIDPTSAAWREVVEALPGLLSTS